MWKDSFDSDLLYSHLLEIKLQPTCLILLEIHNVCICVPYYIENRKNKSIYRSYIKYPSKDNLNVVRSSYK